MWIIGGLTCDLQEMEELKMLFGALMENYRG